MEPEEFGKEEEECSREESETAPAEIPMEQSASSEPGPSEEPGTTATFEAEMFLSNTRERSTQTRKRQGKRSVKTQTVMTATFMSTQTKSAVSVQPVGEVMDEVTDISTDDASTKSHSNERTGVTAEISETHTRKATTEVDLESSTSDESVTPYSEFVFAGASSTESDEDSEDEEPDRRTILVEGKSPQDQIKFIVFEDAMLEVFGRCGQCGSKCIVTTENQIGSSCKICISCTTQSEHYFEWTTGPSLFKMPAFHLLLASGILATGMESAKVLRLFSALNIPNVKQRELSNILKCYVIPAVYKLWQEEQSARVREIEGVPIVIASDMRVDSPGHTGLFGSGSTLDMKRNLILDTQVIKVNIESNHFHI